MPKRLKASKWNGMDDSTKPSKIPLTCLIPRFGAWGGAIAIVIQTSYGALTVPLHCVDDLSTIQDGWGKSSEWVKWHGWQYQAVQDPTYMPNFTSWGLRWCRIAMWTCYSALTVPLHYMDDLSTIQNGWGKISEWVKWHGWQYQANRDPTYMPNFTFWGWRWSRIAMRTCYSALTVPLIENPFSKRSLPLRCFKGENIVITFIISYSWQFFQNGKISTYMI